MWGGRLACQKSIRKQGPVSNGGAFCIDYFGSSYTTASEPQ